jgi:hypothetical protein
MIELTTLDLVPFAARVTARTRVVSGEKDRPYLADGRELAARTPKTPLLRLASRNWPGGQPERTPAPASCR